jgi:hypothetical protein
MINCDCPRCGSRNTKSLSVLYGNGTKRSTYRKDGLFYYRRSVGLHTSTTRGQSQTLSAENSAPPSSSIGTAVMLLTVVGAVFSGAAWYWIGFWIVVLLAVAISDGKDQERCLREWRATFRCGRCGTVFAVKLDNEPKPPVTAVHGESPITPAPAIVDQSRSVDQSSSAQISQRRISDSASRQFWN